MDISLRFDCTKSHNDILVSTIKSFMQEQKLTITKLLVTFEDKDKAGIKTKEHFHAWLRSAKESDVSFRTFKKRMNSFINEAIPSLLPAAKKYISRVKDVDKHHAYLMKHGTQTYSEGITDNEIVDATKRMNEVQDSKIKSVSLKVREYLLEKGTGASALDTTYRILDLYINQWGKSAPPPHLINRMLVDYAYFTRDDPAIQALLHVPSISWLQPTESGAEAPDSDTDDDIYIDDSDSEDQ